MNAPPRTRRWQLPDRETWAVGIGVTLGLVSSGVGPWIVGGLVTTRHFDIEQASLMVTIEQMTMGVVMLVMAGSIHRLPRRPLLIVGVGLALLSQAASYTVEALPAMALSRALSGVGFAVIYALSTAQGAATRDPDRTFAAAQGGTQVAAMALNPLLGLGADLPSHKGVFIVIGAFSLLLAVPYLWLALKHRAVQPLHAPAATFSPISLRSGRVLGVLAVMTVYSIATGGAWNFMERIASGVGLGGAHLGTGLVISSIIGISGSVLANRLGVTFGRIAPLCGGLVALGLITFWFMTPASAWQFWMAVSLWAFLFTFTTPYVFGLAAAADPSGRVVAATGTAFIIVSAMGVYVGAFIVARCGLMVFGSVALAMLALTACIAAAVSRSVAAAQIRAASYQS